MPRITRKFVGREDDEIFDKVHEVMEQIAREFSLDYRQDTALRSGKVSKMGITGAFSVKASEVVVDMKYPMLVPGSMRAKVEDHIERKLDALFA
jgi:Putative polyhydroxyalkanoic acid system protein (PHA_gran_rgn)